MEKYLCPVCGYPDLDEPAYDPITSAPSYDICPCCGCEYGYSAPITEAGKEHFLRNWIRFKTPWHDSDAKPPNWDVRIQLREIGKDFEKFVE